MQIVKSSSMEVFRNLAIEEYLMEQGGAGGPVLFLWQSDCAVVMGKNQNPWKECRLDRMQAEHVPLARRISGGGTVYHDAGNLNYCVMVDRREYDEQQAYDLVFDALKPFGIAAEKTGKSNLSVDGLKFSGNAFCFRKGQAMHHGTLLLNTDLRRLSRYLGSMFDGIETKAIDSVPAKVTNLNLGVEEVSTALADVFSRSYGKGAPEMLTDADLPFVPLEELRFRQLSEAWRYGATPRFRWEHAGFVLEVQKGRVVYAAGMDGASALIGEYFHEIADSLICPVD